MVHIDKMEGGILAAMQFRALKPVSFEFSAGKSFTIGQVQQASQLALDTRNRRFLTFLEESGSNEPNWSIARKAAFDFLSWSPSTSLGKGVVQSVSRGTEGDQGPARVLRTHGEFLNRDIMKSGSEPAYKFEMRVWARSRWVLHDMQHDKGRQLRCKWYQEHIEWGSPLDQLTFAYVMACREVERRVALSQLDDNVITGIDEKTQMKKLLSDTFEWLSIKSGRNKLFPLHEEMRILPYEMDYPESEYQDLPAHPMEGHQLLFARVISDRLIAYARQTWNSVKEAEAAAAKALADKETMEQRPELTAADAMAAEEEAARKRKKQRRR